jgi:16S rRNA (guanine966-N2)-methyltransferase
MGELRVTGGAFRGRRLKVPRGVRDLRPTTEKVREAIFSILGDVSGARVLDLFCGSGALAIEALSRGAATAKLVDLKPAGARRNLDELDLSDRAETIRSDAATFLRRAEPSSFDLVLCDPPYKLADRLAEDLDALIPKVIAGGGRLVAETSRDHPLPMALPLLRERRYGDTLIRVHKAEA